MSSSSSSLTVEEVLAFEDLHIGSVATRRAGVRWSDGTEGEALRWYGDGGVIPSRPRRAPLKRAERGEFRVMSTFMTSNHRRA